MTRPDEYIIRLDEIKNELDKHIAHSERLLLLSNNIKLLPDYETDSTALEKSNIEDLIALLEDDLDVLTAIVWE